MLEPEHHWGSMVQRRPSELSAVLLLAAVVAACSSSNTAETSVPTTTSPVQTTQAVATTATATASTPPTTVPEPTTTLPAVEGPDPSPRVVAFYYPWYGTPEFEGKWIHWNQAGASPPRDIGSDYYPMLGAYSSVDSAVVAQHFAWLREAGIGVIASSWWGQGTRENRAVRVLLDVGERYGIQVAFHIEPYGGRTAASVADDIAYLYERYGDHPAFFRSTETTRWSTGDQPKGLFFVWSSTQPYGQADFVDADYWRDAMDQIHNLPDGGLVIADTPSGNWIDDGHFDGLYNYATLEESPSFDWARTLPPNAWYIPSVIPGFSVKRVGYASTAYTERNGGATYEQQWSAALGTGIEPRMVSITSFNEWHEGTQIEPAESGFPRNDTHDYDDYGDLEPDGYLAMTAELAAGFLATTWEQLAVPRVRLAVETTSDWTVLAMESGGEWIQPVTVSLSETAEFFFEDGKSLSLFQPLDDALAAESVELIIEVGILDPVDPLRFRIERGDIGYTRLTVTGLDGESETALGTALWDGRSDELVNGESGRNPFWFEVDLADS
jgi:glycoprotein endo-alpha-1,2-mannosidase